MAAKAFSKQPTAVPFAAIAGALAGFIWGAKLGHEGDLPVTGDWDGDGKTDIGIFGRAWPGDPAAIDREPGLPAPQNARTGRKNVPPRTDEAALGRGEERGRIRSALRRRNSAASLSPGGAARSFAAV